MYTLPPVPEQETFTTVANAVEKATQPPHSKRLRASAHSDFSSKPVTFRVKWTQLLERDPSPSVPWESVSVSLPDIKPIPPEGFRVALRSLFSESRIASVTQSSVDSSSDKLSGALPGTGEATLSTRNLASPVHTSGGGSSVYNFHCDRVRFPIIKVDNTNSEYDLGVEARQNVDPSLAHHPVFVPSSGNFSFDVFYANKTINPSSISQPEEVDMSAEFVIFPDPYWSRL